MKTAILLSGLHYRLTPRENVTYKNYTIDFRYYVQNIKKYLFSLPLGEIHIFAVTNDSDIINELHKYYTITQLSIMDDTPNRRISKTWRGIELIQSSGIIYDYICITRFDIYFMKPITLNYEKINVFSQLETKNTIDDNFYFMPFSLFSYFASVFQTIKDSHDYCATHYLIFDNIKYICNEIDCVHNLSSFKLRFFMTLFSLNNIYTNNITYHYSKYWIHINNNQIHIYKNSGHFKASFCLLLYEGDYIVKHNYTSNIIINKYLLLNNTYYGNNSNISVTKPTNIHFIFDMPEELNIIFHSISFIKRSQQLFKIK